MTPTAFVFLCHVIGVHDGDTWTCDNGLIVRMWGAASVELKQPSGPAQRDWMSTHILGQWLMCTEKATNNNRTVAQCTLPGPDVAADAVRAGAAADCPLFSKGLYAPLEGSQTVHVPSCAIKPKPVKKKPAPKP